MSTPGQEPAPDPRGLAPLTWLALAVAGIAFLLPLLLFVELADDVVAGEEFFFDRLLDLSGQGEPTIGSRQAPSASL